MGKKAKASHAFDVYYVKVGESDIQKRRVYASCMDEAMRSLQEALGKAFHVRSARVPIL